MTRGFAAVHCWYYVRADVQPDACSWAVWLSTADYGGADMELYKSIAMEGSCFASTPCSALSHLPPGQ